MTSLSAEWIVFDLDDTLYLERDYVRSGFAAVGDVANEYGISDFASVCQQLFDQGVRGDIFNAALKNAGRDQPPELIARLVSAYREHTPSIRLLPEVALTRSALVDGGRRTALLTGGPPASQHRKIEKLALASWCEPIVISSSWGKEFDKPHTRAFVEMENLTGASGPHLTYVADNPAKDFQPTSVRSWNFVRIRRKGSLHEEVVTPKGIPEFSDLLSWIKTLDH